MPRFQMRQVANNKEPTFDAREVPPCILKLVRSGFLVVQVIAQPLSYRSRAPSVTLPSSA